ncbi:MAG: hypothetical protein AB1546_05940, partial [bacterium]
MQSGCCLGNCLSCCFISVLTVLVIAILAFFHFPSFVALLALIILGFFLHKYIPGKPFKWSLRNFFYAPLFLSNLRLLLLV